MLSKIALSRISFRRQILLLGILAVVLLVAVLFATFAALQYTRSAVLRDEQKQLAEVTSTLAREYNQKTQAERLNNKPQQLDEGPLGRSQQELAAISQAVLQNSEGVEGGFYLVEGDALVGSSFPTGSVANEQYLTEAIQDDEGSAVLQTTREAARSLTSSQRILTTGPNISLITALPLWDGQRCIGSAWTMKRLQSVPGTNRFRTYLIAMALGIAALTCVLLTLLVVHGLQNGVRKIEDGLKNLEESLTSRISVDSDPDEIRQIAQAINRLGATLNEKIESEKQIEDRLRHAERLAALGRLIAGVAHEVRNPLATIRLRVQMCQDSGSVDVRESCAVALQEVERLNEMVNRLLSFSRPVKLRTEPTDLERLVKQRLDNLGELARQHDVRFITGFGHGSSYVPADQSRLAQVFDNVIQNAIEAMSATGGTLCVNVRCEAMDSADRSQVCVEFNDTGQGIRPDVVGRIFDPFFTTKSAGTGLGLSICHELVEAHGGNIQVLSQEGCGTTVRILLPVGERTATLA